MENQEMTNLVGVVLAKLKISAVSFFSGLAVLIMAAIMDCALLVVTSYIMIGLNIGSGLCKVLWFKKDWDDWKFFKTGMKLLWFPPVIIGTQWLQNTFQIDTPITEFVAGFLCFHDFRSFVLNVGDLVGIDIWKHIGSFIDEIKNKYTNGTGYPKIRK